MEKHYSLKNHYFLLRELFYTFRWRIFNKILLKKLKVMKIILKLFSIQSVHRCRKDVSISVIDIISRKNRGIPTFKIKRCLSKLYYVIHLPQSQNYELFPFSDGSIRSVQIKGNSSSISPLNNSKTKIYYQDNPRFGLHCHHPIWEIGNDLDRVQFQKVGSSFLPSNSLSERLDSEYQQYHQRFLAQRTSPWRYTY